MSPLDPHWHQRPEDFLAAWSSSRGNLRRFFEDIALPPIDNHTQQQAGEAAAAKAVAELFDLDLSEFTSGLDSVSGSLLPQECHGSLPQTRLYRRMLELRHSLMWITRSSKDHH